MAEILYRMYDLNPKNPTTITDGISIACSDVNAVYPIGSAYTRHAFIVIQDADIIVKNASGNTLQRGADYFISASAADQRYSKDYNTSIYSGIKFKSTGTYTVTSFISCGTYPRATWFNELWDQLITIRDVTVANLSATVSSLSTSVSNMAATVYSTAASLSDLSSLFDTHVADTTFHITSAERAAWNNKTNTYFVANISERNALTGLKSGDRVVVWDDGDGKRAVYFYSGSTWYKDDDPDWENVNVAWSALLNIPANVAAVVNSTGVTATATAGAVAMWNASGKLLSTTPTDADANQTVATVEYVKAKVASAGGGNLSTNDTSSTVGEIVVTDGTTGKLHKKSGTVIGNANGNVPRSNLTENLGLISQQSHLLFNSWSSDTNSILDMALSDFATYGQGLYYYTIKANSPTDPARPWTVDAQAVLMGYPNYARLIAFKLNSKAIAIRILKGGTWETAWTYLTDDSGNAINANSLGGKEYLTLFSSAGSARAALMAYTANTASALLDEEPGERVLRIKTGTVTASGTSATVTFSSVFPTAILWHKTMLYESGAYLQENASNYATMGNLNSGLTITGLTSGKVYRWIAIGY